MPEKVASKVMGINGEVAKLICDQTGANIRTQRCQSDAEKVIISVEGLPDAVEVAAKRVKERAVVPYGEIKIPHSLVNHLIGVRGKRMKEIRQQIGPGIHIYIDQEVGGGLAAVRISDP